MTETAESERIATYALRASPPLMRRGFGVAFGFLAAFLGMGLGIEFRHFAPLAVTMSVGAVLGAALVIVFWRRITHARSSPPIVVTTTHVAFPERKVRLEDITSFEEYTNGAQRVFIVGTTAGFLTYPARRFVDPEGFGGLRDLVRGIVAARPYGGAHLDSMDAREAEARAMNAARTPALLSFLALIALAYGMELLVGLDDRAALLRLGGNAPALVRDGQWWRLCTANFLHFGWLHVCMNTVALLSVGVLIEKALGAARFVVVSLLAGLCGNLASALLGGHAYSAGASAMIFGLIGALLVVNVLHRARLPATLELSRKRWTWLLLINVAISLLPFVDALAHIGGFGGGALAAWALARAIAPNPRVKKATLAAALGLGALYAAGFVGSLVYRSAATTTPAEDYATTRFAAKRPALVNQAAWDVAQDPASALELLARAEKAARRAIALEPDNDSFVDTRAYLLQRLGRADEALALERGAVWRTPRPALAAMLLRMLQSREQEGLLVRRDSSELVVEGAALPEGGVVYARVDRDGRPVGLLRIVLPEGNAGRAPAPASGTLTLTGDMTLHGLWSDGATDRPEHADAPIAAVLEVDAATLLLPWP
jgi:rhomboid protease GluP